MNFIRKISYKLHNKTNKKNVHISNNVSNNRILITLSELLNFSIILINFSEVS